MTGHVTVADNVRGEHRGQAVLRTWAFLPTCAAGPCPTIALLRRRAHGTDRVTLHRRGPDLYRGHGVFYGPLYCAGRVHHPGQRVPFTITVHVTATAVSGGQLVATRLSATYVNPARVNLTRCVAFLGHDAARYRGALMG